MHKLDLKTSTLSTILVVVILKNYTYFNKILVQIHKLVVRPSVKTKIVLETNLVGH